MGKWFSGVVTALVLLLLTSLVGALLKGPIDGLANPNRLNAAVQFSPWTEKPTFADGNNATAKEVVITGKDSTELVKKLEFKQSAMEDFGLAVMKIENSGSGVVKEINIRLKESYKRPQVVFIDPTDNVHIIGESDRLKLPDMNPGDRTTVYLWGNFSPYLAENYFKTYSTEGDFRLSLEWPEVNEFQYNSFIGNLLNDYAWTVFVITSILLLIIFGIGLALYSEYLKGIFVSVKLRSEEARKFRADPDAFNINYIAAQSAWHVYQGRMKERAKVSEKTKGGDANGSDHDAVL